MGADGLLPLGSLPHVVSAVGTGQGARERQARFLRFVKSELDARRADAARRKPLFIVLDGFATLRDEFSDAVSMDLLANFLPRVCGWSCCWYSLRGVDEPREEYSLADSWMLPCRRGSSS